ncbi:CLUMA_CG012063, isoform A [Clunio marinus]|uniref:CLUMA_CG012063, isoform A n=1 Tax=Clunio marinus TaxID=568069 RepID=A0A1J1IIL3_9DIPT|nr:CLUMA_CG012063, isoform A [Clunio marinus]
MVRRCAVHNCKESNITLLAHRFPKKEDMVIKWQNALNLKNYSVRDLQTKFVVCTKHFKPSSYRNVVSSSLNTTAIPDLNDNLDNERIITTNAAYKKNRSAPIRCHKYPNELFIEETLTEEKPKVKKAKIEDRTENTELQKEHLVVEVDMIGVVNSADEIEEHVERKNICNDIQIDTKPVKTKSVATNTEKEIHKNVEIESKMIETKAIATNTEEEMFKVLNLNIDPQIILTDQQTQTETDHESNKKLEDSNQSKDNKIFGILYPELASLNKMQLGELVAERNRKIESLEEKVNKLEAAMKSLL